MRPNALEVEMELLRMERESSEPGRRSVVGGWPPRTGRDARINDPEDPAKRASGSERPLTKFEWQLAQALLDWGRKL